MDTTKFVKIDAQATTGGEYLLTAVRDVYEYVNGVRGDKRIGTVYEVVCPKRAYHRLNVKILDKAQQIQIEEGEVIPIRFEALELFLYWRAGSVDLGARATGISVVNTKA